MRDQAYLETLAGRPLPAPPVGPRVVSCAAPPTAADAAEAVTGPQGFRLAQWFDHVGEASIVNDRIGLDVHGEYSATHIDARSHYFSRGRGAGGMPAPDLGTETVANDVRDHLPGIVGRGVFIDLLDAASDGRPVPLQAVLGRCGADGIEPRPGDTLYFRMGRAPLPAGTPGWYDRLPGLSIECAEWLLDIGPAAVVTDSGLDPAPSEVIGVASPWHELLLMRVGIPIVDMAALDRLADACREEGSATFLSVIAPLDLPHTTGSPVNPLAIFDRDYAQKEHP